MTEAEILDGEGNAPSYSQGDRVRVLPLNGALATVDKQILHHDCGETFWGNLVVTLDTGEKLECHCWQVKKAEE